MFDRVVVALDGVAQAIREGSQRGSNEDIAARERIAALEKALPDGLAGIASRFLPLEGAERTLRDALARHAEAIAGAARRIEALEQKREVVDPARVVAMEQELAALRLALKKLNGKLAGDPEFNPRAGRKSEEEAVGEPTIFLGGGELRS